jgi:hypothetical protein
MCEGNTWVACDAITGKNGSNGTRRFKCDGVGETCVVAGNNIDCGFASCAGGAPECLADGTTLQLCANGILQKTDCARLGSVCVPGDLLTPVAHCRGTGRGCQGNFHANTLRCDGSVLVTCSDGQEARYDCGADNLGCFPDFNGDGGFGCALAGDCDPNNYTAVCMGLQLKFCNKGKVQTIDCGSSGFNGCDPSGGGRCTKS